MLEQLSLIIPSFNGADALQKTLAKLQAEQITAEIIVVDGGSSDGSQAVATGFGVRLLEVQNHGYGHNLNRGIEIATRQYLALMNSDVLMPRQTLLAALKRLENPSLGAVGPVPLQENGSRQQSFGITYLPNHLKITQPLAVKMLHGFCLITRRDVLQTVGGFDEHFFMYNEEYDWCWRVLKKAYSLEIIPETAVHFGGSSTPNSAAIFFEGRRGGMYLVDKHFPFWVAEPTRRFFQLEAWLSGFFERRTDFKPMWQRLEQQLKQKNYLGAALPLSGRGEVHFKPNDSVH